MACCNVTWHLGEFVWTEVTECVLLQIVALLKLNADEDSFPRAVYVSACELSFFKER